jgi:hypothetical protein
MVIGNNEIVNLYDSFNLTKLTKTNNKVRFAINKNLQD